MLVHPPKKPNQSVREILFSLSSWLFSKEIMPIKESVKQDQGSVSVLNWLLTSTPPPLSEATEVTDNISSLQWLLSPEPLPLIEAAPLNPEISPFRWLVTNTDPVPHIHSENKETR